MKNLIPLWLLAVVSLVTFATSASAQAAPPTRARPPLPRPSIHCAKDAIQQADKLLKFHSDNEDRVEVDSSSIRKIGTVKSLLGNRRFDVLQIEGSVYKGSYRMRLIYADLSGQCVLIGQEIFERTGL